MNLKQILNETEDYVLKNNISINNDTLINNETEYFSFHKNRYFEILNIIKNFYNKNSRILDVGSHFCHILIGSRKLGFKPFGIDLKQFTDQTKERARSFNIEIKECDLEKNLFPHDDNYFDLIHCGEVLEHLNFHPLKVFREIYRVLKPNGRVIITTPNLLRLNNRVKMILGKSINYDIEEEYSVGTHFREYSAREIIYLLKTSKFSSVEVKYADFNYPDSKKTTKLINKIIGFVIPLLKGNLIIIGTK